MIEIWKDVVGYEGLYQVSNCGNVRSLNWKNTGMVRNMCPRLNNKGYFIVNLSKDSKSVSKSVHRLVAQAFLPNTLNYTDVNHIDENPRNNCVENLEWCTHKSNVNKYNANHPEHFRSRKSTERYQKRLNLKVSQFLKDGTLVRIWDNSRTVYLETGMSDWSVSQCCRGQRKQAHGYIWRYAI